MLSLLPLRASCKIQTIQADNPTGYGIAMNRRTTPSPARQTDAGDLERDRKRLRKLYEITVDTGAPMNERLQNMLKAGTRMLDLDIGIISRIEGRKYTLLQVHAPGMDLARNQVFELGSTYCDITRTADDLVAIDHMESSDHSGHPCYQAFRLEAYVGVPLKVLGQPYGTLNFSSPRPALRHFTDTDLDLVRLMGRWVSDVLEKKEIETELLAHRHNLESLVEKRTRELNLANVQLSRKIREAAQAEKALKDHLAVLNAFIDTIPEPVFFKDALGRYKGCNAAFAGTILGLAKGDIVGRTLFELESVIPPELAGIYHQRDLEMLKGGNTQSYEAPVKCADGNTRHFLFSKATYSDDHGYIAGLVGVMVDITGRKASEEELARLTSILEATNDFVSTALPDGRLTYINRAGRKMVGWDGPEALSSRRISDTHPPWAYEIVKTTGVPAAIAHGIWSGETALLSGDGTEIPVSQVIMSHKDQDGRLQYLSTIIRDMTDIKCAQEVRLNLENRLRQAQKMESIGTLAGGIAHDFNNILSAMLGFTEITQQELPPGSPFKSNLGKVLQAGQRARDLVHQILTFSRQTEHEIKPMRVRPVVAEALKLLRATLPSTISIEAELSSEAMVMADPVQIHQAVMNLCTNGAHAMQAEGGRLTVRLFDAHLGEQACGGHPGLKPGDYLSLQVADTGHGMSPEVRERIFDPFFTTKSKGEGTGLGLSMVHGIITQCGGVIEVESAPGRGTTFTLYFSPIETREDGTRPRHAPLPAGKESILFVDDEDFQADLGRRMLQSLGYRVTSLTGSREALEVFLKSADDFDLVVTDMTMPQMTGDVLAVRIKQHRPEMPVIICTGFSSRMDEKAAHTAGIAAYLHKPILMSELAVAVRKALDESGLPRAAGPGTVK